MTNRAKRKHYHDMRCRKELLIRTKYNKRSVKRSELAVERHSNRRGTYHRLSAPQRLDIFNDTDESIAFFSKVLKTVNTCHVRDKIYFDLSKVEHIEPGAIMYIIAIIRNVRRIRSLKISCEGNMPENKVAREVISQSGFFSFVSPASPLRIATDNKYMKIANGKDADGKLAGSFCDFVQSRCQTTNLHTKRLYPMIVELMTNTHQHAYEIDRDTIMKGNWYIFARDTENSIRFIFLDTGVGIPKTVSKRFVEHILIKNDAAYLESVLRGDFRTETKQKHRGKGIPGIYEDACDRAVEGLSIISGKGKCEVDSDAHIVTTSLSDTFVGTLFAWDIPKEGNDSHGN